MVSSPVDQSVPAVDSEGVPPAVLEGTDQSFSKRFGACSEPVAQNRKPYERFEGNFDAVVVPRVHPADDLAMLTPPTTRNAHADARCIAGEDQLIARAKDVFATMTGVKDDSVLAEDFRFEFPVVSLDKEAYLKAVRGFSLDQAIPDMNSNAYDFRVDPFEPNRVWFTIRNSGTHTGDLKFAGKTYEGTGKKIQGAPECCSYTFDDNLLVTSFTGGYVMDRRVGNTGGMGALFGILHAIGAPVPRPGSLMWNILSLINKIRVGVTALFSKLVPASADKTA